MAWKRALIGLATLTACSSDPVSSEPAAQPLPAEEVAVAFEGAAGLTLEGTLTLPARDARTKVPAALLLNGSGPISRDEPLSGQLLMSFGFSVPAFKLLAAALASTSVAVLRYDKRSCGVFNGCSASPYPVPPASTDADIFVNDAVAAAQYLATRSDIDPTRIAVIGHSEGGTYVPLVLNEATWLERGVLLSAPEEPFDVVLQNQVDFATEMLRESGDDPEQINAILGETRDIARGLAALRAGDFKGSEIGGLGVDYWVSLLAQSDSVPPTALAIPQPLLFLGGDYDWNVPPLELDLWRQALAKRAGTTRFALIPCVTHALNCVSQPDYHLITDQDIGRELDGDVIEMVSQFVADAER
jgi:dienelactone hydrolase